MKDEEIIDFFANPIERISTYSLEGNRLFECVLLSSTGSGISIFSSIVDISDIDEIGVISVEKTDKLDLGNNIVIPDKYRKSLSINKIIGDYDVDECCECGIVLESSGGLISICSGAFPASINITCPGFDQGLRVTSFQPLKYYLKPMHIY